MAKTKKSPHQPSLLFQLAIDALHQEDNWLWISLHKEWRDVTTKPKEIVRQKFIHTLLSWQRGEAPAYPLFCLPATQYKPVCLGEVAKEYKKAVTEFKKQVNILGKSAWSTLESSLFSASEVPAL